ncbi:MAG: roadblock/LC7 domain-containing protein [Methylomonas sp.]|nr:roadblock/LC7 domain-containing protein [Methylomonas sp.]
MRAILQELNQKSKDIEASAIISKDGLVLASLMPNDVDENCLGGMTAALFSVGLNRTQEFSGGLEQMMVKGSDGYVLMTQAGEGIYLTVTTKVHAEFEQIFLELKHAARKIADLSLEMASVDAVRTRGV